jgi:hypothetical protein
MYDGDVLIKDREVFPPKTVGVPMSMQIGVGSVTISITTVRAPVLSDTKFRVEATNGTKTDTGVL